MRRRNGLLAFVLLACSRSEPSSVAVRPSPAPSLPASSDASPIDASQNVSADCGIDITEIARLWSLRPLGKESPYCDGKPCRDYAESVERIRRLAAPGAGPGCLN